MRACPEIRVLNVTTGPGGINALNGVFGAWTDSVPLLVISGQVKRETCIACRDDVPGLRQLGDQEVDILRMAQGITKYAVLVDDPSRIRYHLERAYRLARSGRPGPLAGYPHRRSGGQHRACIASGLRSGRGSPSTGTRRLCAATLDRLRSATRPVIMAGTGIRAAGALDAFERVIPASCASR